MDFERLEKLFHQMQPTKASTSEIANFIVVNSHNAENQIARLIDKEFNENLTKHKVGIFMVVKFIFEITSKQKDKRFFKPLTQKAKGYIEELSRRCIELPSDHILMLAETLSAWFIPGQQLFVPAFTLKLKKVAEPLLEAAKKIQQEKKNGIFDNYSKTFLMEYEDISSYEPTKRIYQDFRKYDEMAKQIGDINQETKRLNLQTPTHDIKERAKVLKTKLQSFNQGLQDLICNYHVDFKLLREACRQEFERMPPEAKKLLETSKTE